MAQAGHDGAACGGRGAQVERLALVAQGDRRRALAAARGRRFRDAVVRDAQVLVFDIAGERSVLHAAPCAAVFKQRDLRAMRHLRQNRGGGARLLAQVQAVQRVAERDHRRLRVRGRLVRHVRRAVHGGQERAGHGVLRADDARVVEIENLVIGEALVRHLLRAALTHAHAVAKSPGGELEAAAGVGDAERLVLEHVDAHGAQALHLIEVIQRDRRLPVARERHADRHLREHAGGLGVLGRMHGHIVDAADRSARHARLCDGFRPQKLRKRRHAGGSVFVEGDRLGDGRAVAQVVRVILDLQIGIGAAAPRIGDGLRLPAVGRGVVAGHVIAVHRADDAARLLHGLHAAGVPLRRAVVHLVAGGIHKVIGRRLRAHFLERIGARGHRLRLECFQREGVVQLVGQHAPHVILHVDVHDNLHIAALGNELDVARIEVLRLSRLCDAHAVAAAGLVTAELKAAAHGLRPPVHGHQQRAAAVPDVHLRAARDGPGRIPADGVAAVDGHIHARIGTDGGQIHAHRTRDRRALYNAAVRRSHHRQQQQHSQQHKQRGQPFPFCRCHVSIPLSPWIMPVQTHVSDHKSNRIVPYARRVCK